MRHRLKEYLESLHPRVYFQLADDEAEFPYVVFDFTSSYSTGENSEIMMVDVTAWDCPADGDTTEVENLIETINAGLDKYILAIDGDYAVFFLNTKVYTPDQDNRLKRRTYTYDTIRYERS